MTMAEGGGVRSMRLMTPSSGNATTSRPAGGEGHRNRHDLVCRYFLHGACTRGSNCNFSHDKTRTSAADMVCRYYLAGCCSYGDKCRYDHVRNQGTDRGLPESDNKPQVKEKKQSVNGAVPERKSTMVKLSKQSLAQMSQEDSRPPLNTLELNAAARDFVPGQKFHGSGIGYADAVHSSDVQGAEGGIFLPTPVQEEARAAPKESDLLCPYFAHGHCPYEDRCEYVHGDICEMCGFPRLHPTDQEQRKAHEKECLMEHENDMELSFLLQESAEKECGICLDKVLDKAVENGTDGDCRFGILENCNHCFCLKCIKEWRSNRSAEKLTHRSCPICRTPSNFVTPSVFWVEDPEKKKSLIDAYLTEIAKKPCQYFKQGQGKCPFGNSCHYLHALPDGSIAPPEPVRKPRRRYGEDGEVTFVDEQLLWDFLRRRDETSQRISDLAADMPEHLTEDVYDIFFSTLGEQDVDELDEDVLMSIEHQLRTLTALGSSEESSDEDFF